jgi:hypothetical protein
MENREYKYNYPRGNKPNDKADHIECQSTVLLNNSMQVQMAIRSPKLRISKIDPANRPAALSSFCKKKEQKANLSSKHPVQSSTNTKIYR